MMKNDVCMERNCGRRGAALMIALMAAVIVMLAATLLISMTRRMVQGHRDRLIATQISLSETSAAEGLAWRIETEGVSSVSGGTSFQLAGVTTEFTLREAGSAGIRSGFYPVGHPDDVLTLPAGSMMVAAFQEEEGMVVFRFYDSETFQVVFEYSVETSSVPVSAAPLINTEAAGAVFILDAGGESVLCAVDENGLIALTEVPPVYLPRDAHLSAAFSPDGTPLLITTNGANLGVLYDVSTGLATHLSSPAGTCPSFMPDGSLFGSMGAPISSFSVARVRDVFPGDFNSDGSQDLAFATSWSLSWASGASPVVYSAAPGGSLVCWGEVENRNGLVGMWQLPQGEESWYRLGWNGFTEFIPENTYRSGWQGRFIASGNTFTGFIDGHAVVASTSGMIQELFAEGAYTGDADGGDMDFFREGTDGIEAVFNPVRGDGYRMVFDTENICQGSRTRGNSYVFDIYATPEGTRVFHSMEGVSR